MKKSKSESEVYIHYILERPYMVTFWSMTIFLICLVVIISLETGRPTIISIFCGLLSLLLVLMARNRQIIINEHTIEVYHLFKHRRMVFDKRLSSIYWKANALTIQDDTKMKKVYLTKKAKAAFDLVAKQYNLNVMEGRD